MNRRPVGFKKLNGILFILILLFGPGGLKGLAQENQLPSGIHDNAEKADPDLQRVLSELEEEEGKEVAEIIQCMHLLENLDFLKQDSEKIKVLDLLILSSQ